MGAEFGPYVQMRTLAVQMAACYQMDASLVLEPFLAHFMDEVEVNIAADTFDHAGFIQKIRLPLEALAASAVEPRRQEFLRALVDALHARELRLRGTSTSADLGHQDISAVGI